MKRLAIPMIALVLSLLWARFSPPQTGPVSLANWQLEFLICLIATGLIYLAFRGIRKLFTRK